MSEEFNDDDLTEVVETGTPVSEETYDQIGRYRLLQKLGEGGMGAVYLAEQSEPVRRRVALKVIKLGMDTKRVIARFEAERQALAVMDHPNIASVYDAGATENGRPFFVMELVQGVPITQYCDRHQLSIRDRLELFISVCQGIQHAHQKGVIHRDIKPSNILVSQHEGGALPKIIDFGVSKATGPQMTDKTLFTAMGEFVGTPAYMSPEQADLSGMDIDTRTDIYSLGVMLYELLTGELPFGTQETRQASFMQLQRKISQENPPTPSTRLMMRSGDPEEIARHRHTDPGSLVKEVRGDLDWIVMKVLEKDRSRRYDTANGLALDIRRHLDNKPILARPPSAGYQLLKFVQRNRLGVALASVLAVVLLAGSIGTAVGFFKAQLEARKARTVTAFVTDMLSKVDPETAQGREVTVREVLDEAARDVGRSFADQPELEAELRAIIGSMYSDLGFSDDAVSHLDRSVALYERSLGPRHEKTIDALNLLGRNHVNLRQFDDAASVWRRLLRICQQTLGQEHRDTLTMMQNLAAAYLHQEDYENAEPLLLDVIERRRRVLGEDNPQYLASVNNLASLYMETERYDQAEPLLVDALDERRRTLGDKHPRTLISAYNLGDLYHRTDRDALAEPLMREALDGFQRVHGEDHPYTLISIHSLAKSLLRLERFADAERLGLDSYERHRSRYGADHHETVTTVQLMVELYDTMGREAKSAEYRAKLP